MALVNVFHASAVILSTGPVRQKTKPRLPSPMAGAQQRGAGGGFELADLAGEDGGPDTEVAGCVAEAGLAGEGEEPADALLGAWAGEDVPDVSGERAGAGTSRSRCSDRRSAIRRPARSPASPEPH
jgi:hypothetical protein